MWWSFGTGASRWVLHLRPSWLGSRVGSRDVGSTQLIHASIDRTMSLLFGKASARPGWAVLSV